MRKFIFFLFIFLGVRSLANAQMYRAVDDNGTVALVMADGDIEEAWIKHPLYGHKYVDVESSKLPDPEDRQYWKVSGKSVVVDMARKQADIDAQSQKQAAQDAVLAKLKISKLELDSLNAK